MLTGTALVVLLVCGLVLLTERLRWPPPVERGEAWAAQALAASDVDPARATLVEAVHTLRLAEPGLTLTSAVDLARRVSRPTHDES